MSETNFNSPDAPALRQRLLADHEQRMRELEMRVDTLTEKSAEYDKLIDRISSIIPGGIK